MSYVKTADAITFSYNGTEVVTVSASHPRFDEVVACVKTLNWNRALELSQPAKMIESNGKGKITVRDGIVWYGDVPLHNSLTDRIVRMFEEGSNVDPMINFLENLMQNPSQDAIEELYEFLAYGQLPITQDGHFLAYKHVREDYRDVHSGRFDNSPGKEVEMNRADVCDDKNVTCAPGLHFCSYEYLAHYPGNRIVVLKINPKDVVSIPVDYNNTKGRCCYYKVLRDLSEMGDMRRAVYVGAVNDEAKKQHGTDEMEFLEHLED